MRHITVENHGNVWLLRPLSKKGKRWLHRNLQTEPWQWLGKGVAVDQHYIEDILDGMQQEELL